MTPTVESLEVREALMAHRDEVDALLARYGASNPRLFGSVARGDADSQEDIVSRYITLGAESASTDALVTVEVTPLHEMTSGKLCAQVAHAA